MIKKPIKLVVNTPGRIIKPSFRFPVSSSGPREVFGRGRYWRFVSLGLSWFNDHDYKYGIWEIGVYSSTDCTGENLALDKPPFANRTYTSLVPEKANDGNSGTAWFSVFYGDPEEELTHWGFDALSEITVRSVSFYFKYSHFTPRELLIQYSNDEENWTDFATIVTENVTYQTQEFTDLL